MNTNSSSKDINQGSQDGPYSKYEYVAANGLGRDAGLDIANRAIDRITNEKAQQYKLKLTEVSEIMGGFALTTEMVLEVDGRSSSFLRIVYPMLRATVAIKIALTSTFN